MAEAIPMLALSPTMTEGTIAAWKYAEGQAVKKGSVLCEVETDKAVMDYEAPVAGTLLKIVVPSGEGAAVGTLIAVIGREGEEYASLIKAAGAAQAAAPATKPAAASPPVPAVAGTVSAPPPAATPDPTQAATVPGGGPALAPGYPPSSPLARVLAREAGLDLRSLRGSGPHGRVVKRDVEAGLESGLSAASVRPAAGVSGAVHAGLESADPGPGAALLADRVVPLSRLRAVIAKRLGDSMRDAPHFFLRAAVATDRLAQLRRSANEDRAEPDRLSLNAYFVKLSAAAIALNPGINAIWRGDGIEYRRSVDVALAVAVGDGLVAPVVRDCVHKSVSEIEAEFRGLIARAKAGALKPEDYEGATFTISNLGAWGVEEFTAIINPPGSAILALGAMVKEPVVEQNRDGKDVVHIRSRLRATLSCDHRVIDGALGAAFLRDLKTIMEEPARALV